MAKVKGYQSFRVANMASILAVSALAVLVCVLFTANVAAAAPCSANSDSTLATALGSASCTTITVLAGNYTGPIDVTRSVILEGANAGINPNRGSRNAESIILSPNGQAAINIEASDVVVDGFTIGNSSEASGSNGADGIDIEASTAGTVIANNIINGITSENGTAQAIYLVHGPDGVLIQHNLIENVSGDQSTKGVFIGDSNIADPSNVVIVDGNKFKNITSVDGGAYGVTTNLGSHLASFTVSYGLVVKNNIFDNLTSTNGWVHAVGIEADAPGAVITGNSFRDLSGPGSDVVAVWFENEDPSYATSKVNRNNFFFNRHSGAYYGIAVYPGLGTALLDGTNNYWGSPFGPGGEGHGRGVLVSKLVKFRPWARTPNGHFESWPPGFRGRW